MRRVNSVPSMTASSYKVSGSVGIPIFDNYQDRSFGMASKRSVKAKGKFSRTSNIMMFNTEEICNDDGCVQFRWDSDRDILEAFKTLGMMNL